MRHGLRVPREQAELARLALEEAGWLDRTLRPMVEAHDVVWLLNKVPEGPAPLGSWTQVTGPFLPAPPPIDPHSRLRRSLEEWLEARGVEPDLRRVMLDGLPQRWERLGDLALLPSDAFQDVAWKSFVGDEGPWEEVASALKVQRLGRQAPVAADGHRSSQATLLLGNDGVVDVVDHGVRFLFDATRQMFSSGNVTERHRMGGLDLDGEVVVDAFAGVGYYTLPMLVRAGAAHVHACEWNPEAAAWLSKAAEANGVGHRLTVHTGDNRSTLPTLIGLADRVVLGLLPSSEHAWEDARRCLKPEGGWLHVHMNVEEERVEEWAEQTAARLEGEVHHLERVKWYAPRIRHVVLDVRCS